MINNNLAIAIPTFNRTDILKENLIAMLPEISAFNIPIYISDNGDNASTKFMIEELNKNYPYLFYSKNKENIGYDLNFVKTVSLPEQDYIWFLGDGLLILPGYVKKVLDIIDSYKYDFIGINTASERVGIPFKIYSNPKALFQDFYWHLTLAGATIYSKKIISYIENFDILQYRNFPQNGLIFNSIVHNDFIFYWSALPAVTVNIRKKSYWNNSVFETFLFDWSNSIEKLPANYQDLKKIVLPTHAKLTGLFNLYNMLNYRIKKILTYESYLQYKNVIRDSSSKSLVYFFILSITPIFIITPILLFANLIKRFRK